MDYSGSAIAASSAPAAGTGAPDLERGRNVGFEDASGSADTQAKSLQETIQQLERERKSVEDGTHLDFVQRCAVFEAVRVDSVAQAASHREAALKSVENMYQFALHSAERTCENNKNELRASLLKDLQERIAETQAKLTGQPEPKQQDARGQPQRRLRSKTKGDAEATAAGAGSEPAPAPSTSSALKIDLPSGDILSDMKAIYRDWKATAARWRTAAATALLPARVERGRLYYASESFAKGEPVVVFSELTKQEFVGEVYHLSQGEVIVKLDGGTKCRIPLQHLRHGRVSMYRYVPTASAAAAGAGAGSSAPGQAMQGYIGRVDEGDGGQYLPQPGPMAQGMGPVQTAAAGGGPGRKGGDKARKERAADPDGAAAAAVPGAARGPGGVAGLGAYGGPEDQASLAAAAHAGRMASAAATAAVAGGGDRRAGMSMGGQAAHGQAMDEAGQDGPEGHGQAAGGSVSQAALGSLSLPLPGALGGLPGLPPLPFLPGMPSNMVAPAVPGAGVGVSTVQPVNLPTSAPAMPLPAANMPVAGLPTIPGSVAAQMMQLQQLLAQTGTPLMPGVGQQLGQAQRTTPPQAQAPQAQRAVEEAEEQGDLQAQPQAAAGAGPVAQAQQSQDVDMAGAEGQGGAQGQGMEMAADQPPDMPASAQPEEGSGQPGPGPADGQQ